MSGMEHQRPPPATFESAPPAGAARDAAQRRRHAVALRPTYSRLQVLQAVQRAGAHGIGCQALYVALLRGGAALPLATIYRVAKDLADAGLLARGLDSDQRVIYLPPRAA